MDLIPLARETISPTTIRFRMLVSHFMLPAEEAQLLGYRDGEAQLSLSLANKPPIFIVIIDGAREEERSLRLRLGRLASEKVENQHIVVVANHSWMPAALRKMADEFWPKMNLYQLNADGELEVKARQPLRPLLAALRAQKRAPLPVAGVPMFTGSPYDSGLASETEESFAARCARSEEHKERLRGDYADLLKHRPPGITVGILAIQAALWGLFRLWQSGADSATTLVQLGAAVPLFVRDGDYWRLLASAELHSNLFSALLALLLWLSLGTLLEKLLGMARFVTLHVLSGLAGTLVALYWSRSSQVLISVGASGAACGLFGAGAMLALEPTGLPPQEAQRLRKIALGGLITATVLTLLPGVFRPTHLGGFLGGALLMASGLLRPPPMGSDGKLAESNLVLWLQRGLGLVCGLLLVGSLVTALLKGHPWQPDKSWQTRLSRNLNRPAGDGERPSAAMGLPNGNDVQGPGASAELVRHELSQIGATLELPKALGEGQLKEEPGHPPLYEFGDLGEKQQLLTVLVQRYPRPIKKQRQLEEALSQAAAQIRADKIRGDRSTVLTPEVHSTLDGWPTTEFHIRMQESVQARGLLQARKSSVIALWYVFTDLLPETVQLDLKRAAHSLNDGAAPTKKEFKKPKKKKRH